MTKNKCTANDHGRMAMASMGGENNCVSGYCRVCCNIYIFQAKFSNEASVSCIDGTFACELSVMHVEESGMPIKPIEVADFNKVWNIRPKTDNELMACSVILEWLEQLTKEEIFDTNAS